MKNNPKRIFAYIGLLALTTMLTLPAASQESQLPAQEPRPIQEPELVVPAGTIIPIVLGTFLNSKNTQPGDLFYAQTAYPVWIQQRLVIPRGSDIKGTVTEVYKGSSRGKGKIAIRFDSVLLPNGVERPLVANLHGIHGPGAEQIDRKTETVKAGSTSNPGAEAATVVSNAGNGALIGGVAAHGGEPALIGAAAGAMAGVVIMLLSRDHSLVLQEGTQFDIELRQPLRYAYNEVIFSQFEAERMVRKAPVRPAQKSPKLPMWGGIGIPRIWR
jgi:hypothetical protein